MPNDIQVGLLSATMTPEFFRLSDSFMRNPVKILVKNEDLTLKVLDNITLTEHNEYNMRHCVIYTICVLFHKL